MTGERIVASHTGAATMELDAKTLLRRFCHLGSFIPVYVHKRDKNIEVKKYWLKLKEICATVEGSEFITLMKHVLNESAPARRDEALFVYAVYLTNNTGSNPGVQLVRDAFPACARLDTDLFLFCKYALLIQKEQSRNRLTKTVQVAITLWYAEKSPDELQDMWISRRGAYGFTHKMLMKLCHINDRVIGAQRARNAFFKTCTEILKETEEDPSASDVELSMNADASTEAININEATKSESDSMDIDDTPMTAAETDREDSKDAKTGESTNLVSEPEQPPIKAQCAEKPVLKMDAAPILAMSKLRTTKSIEEAERIIRKYKIPYSQTPRYLMAHASIAEALIPTMSVKQLIGSWRSLACYKHLQNPRIVHLCKMVLETRADTCSDDNIVPINMLLHMDRILVHNNPKFRPVKHRGLDVKDLQIPLLKNVYTKSFGYSAATGLRINITINLQNNYRQKILHNYKKLSYLDASVSLAFEYFKKERFVNVFHWVEDKMKLEQIPWSKEMNIDEAIACCQNINNVKSSQRLVVPIVNALGNSQTYDLFLAIVPSAGRSNPKQKSDFLCKFLDRYREVNNLRAKYVIVNFRKLHRSMTYSESRNENILEICGVDQHTTNLINDFGLNHFG